MRTITKALVGIVTAGSMAMTSASPVFAQRDRDSSQDRQDSRDQDSRDSEHDRDRDHDRDHDRGISAGDVIAGAVIVGGIAAVAASIDDNGRYDNNNRYDRRVYGAGRSREAVELCVNAAERRANRFSYGGRADVTDIRGIDRTRAGFTVTGRIAVNTQGHSWRSGDNYRGRGWGNDYRGWDNNLRGYDSGRFTCDVRYGRVVDVNFRGLRGL